ncbi:ATP-grasp domain-containing protein [Vibrio penaeicida]|uniref:ATP-grasp domain-containing protein n=3 Tax=Vibrio penaeicida TaxID=104609 RepID=A0AAV5NWF7_9VIBR|nr:ATP-grasp domain-containing protein [Vibrio penaeicida]GLQ74878.1 hypothetical protein GCM10007932_42400 [Vibrio penaeicida]
MEEKMKHVLIIGGYFNRFDSFENINTKISLIQEKHMIHDLHMEACEKIYTVDKFEPEEALAIAKELHADSPIDYIFSFIEEGLYTAAYISKNLGVAGMDYDVHTLCLDKIQMRERLSGTEFSINSIQTENYEDALDFFYENGGKIVLKDPSGCRSENVFICKSESELEKAWAVTHVSKVYVRLLEEYLDGREYTLECLSLNNNHIFLGATKTYLHSGMPVEDRHIFPAPDVTQDEYFRLESFCKRLLNQIDFQHGPMHIEVRLSESGIKLIEINNRTAGGFIWQLVKLSTGIDMLTETILNAFNENTKLKQDGITKKSNYMASFVIYESVDVDKLRKELENLMSVSTLYCMPKQRNKTSGETFDGGDALGFLAGEMKEGYLTQLDNWINKVEEKILLSRIDVC